MSESSNKKVTVEMLCEELTISRQTCYNWRREGKIPVPFQIGGRLYWSRETLNEFYQSKQMCA